MKTEQIPAKSRFDIIDTALQQQQELRVLRYLLLLFVITVVYEFGHPLMFPEEEGEMTISTSNSRRTSLPRGRIERFVQAFSNLIGANPQLRESLERERINLSLISAQIAAGPLPPETQKDFADLLVRFWNYSHLQVWDNPEIFREIDVEIKALLGILSLKPSDTIEPPDLSFRPKILTEMETPRRDIFNFSNRGQK